ncbi:putative vacuolar protein sorting-associated protein Ist1 [Helianthus annuus]|uniref:Vacuolar protein sorting-associated protein Ist1 n=2 Tax=Helianthus annuus TaxID=4232 RepID=A0A9K3GUX6_HELAN|nr:putative vacuolar protein sorting-associated protein Ist1 [Helianthus annuus]
MKNKKGVQINQMKRELAQLLETGQERTDRIRVEHVIREEKMVATYDLIEIYCEFIVGRLPIIESQKTCPVDLKEAVTSVICAAPRCSDISEFYDVRKQFTANMEKILFLQRLSCILIAVEKVKTSSVYIRDSTNISDYALLMFGGNLIPRKNGYGIKMLDEYLQFSASKSVLGLIKVRFCLRCSYMGGMSNG